SDITLNEIVKNGVGFDASSYKFSKVENSDMILIPDLNSAVVDPFREAPTLSFFSNIYLTDNKRSRFEQDARFVAEKAESLLKKLKIADESWWGPEFEFYIFSNVEYDTRTASSFYNVEHAEEFYGSAYHAANPFDIYDDFRDEACAYLKKLGVKVKYHHHEGGERGQQEIETYFMNLLEAGDKTIITKYTLFNLSRLHNLFITFMPKPMFQQSGNGLHVHQFLTKNKKNIFYKKGAYANLSQTALYYIGGLLKHASALSAFTNPSTNSYKRLVPGFEAPVAISFGQANRSSAIRIPKYINDPQMTRLEYRPPDATANPYLCLSAMLMAGIDGVINKIDPTKEGFGPYDTNIFDIDRHSPIHFLPRNLDEALDALEADNAFLKRESVFTEGLINQWVKLKEEEIKSIATMPHPFEYKMYFNL
ncbi:MAG: type I glutamate--ammonia ligase, partial [Ignavibacteria bacterium]|nr:type I glutamate--ammonia ligase [Ignavibacteria bacterium]